MIKSMLEEKNIFHRFTEKFVLHNHNLEGLAGDDVITAFRQWLKIEDFFRQS